MPYQGKKNEEYEYPLLMKSSYSGTIVMMTSYGKGVVRGTGNTHMSDRIIGQRLSGLNMNVFHPITDKNIKE